MQALLATGEIVELKKDCPCTHHDGPHWLHMDRVWRSLNRQLWQPAMSEMQCYALATEEGERLREKRLYMERYGIVELMGERGKSECSATAANQ